LGERTVALVDSSFFRGVERKATKTGNKTYCPSFKNGCVRGEGRGVILTKNNHVVGGEAFGGLASSRLMFYYYTIIFKQF
jgi:hypothetical protein